MAHLLRTVVTQPSDCSLPTLRPHLYGSAGPGGLGPQPCMQPPASRPCTRLLFLLGCPSSLLLLGRRWLQDPAPLPRHAHPCQLWEWSEPWGASQHLTVAWSTPPSLGPPRGPGPCHSALRFEPPAWAAAGKSSVPAAQMSEWTEGRGPGLAGSCPGAGAS